MGGAVVPYRTGAVVPYHTETRAVVPNHTGSVVLYHTGAVVPYHGCGSGVLCFRWGRGGSSLTLTLLGLVLHDA